jgi:hypothetical protein
MGTVGADWFFDLAILFGFLFWIAMALGLLIALALVVLGTFAILTKKGKKK